MLVVVVQVGSVRMLVLDPVVLMWMTVRLGDGPGVRVAVVLVVHVQVLVLDRFVDVEVGVLLADEQRDPGCHQHRGQAFARGEALVQKRHGQQGPCERRGGEQGGLAGRAEDPHGLHVPDDGRPVAERADNQGGGHRARRGQPAPERQPEQQRTRSASQPFEAHQRDRVAERKPLGQVRVQRPCNAREHERSRPGSVQA